MKQHEQHELNLVYDAREVVDPAVRGQRRRDGFTQHQAVGLVLDVMGDDIALEDLRELASQEYGRTITLGITLRNKMEWLGRLERRQAA
jgi:hypothetical protein